MSPDDLNTDHNGGVKVRVRMYRQGLGDCFLLSFTRQDQARHMLIDCGVLLGTKDGTHKVQQVVQDIRQTTGDHLNVVVATHEHWDHLSGFAQAQELFDQIQIDEVWLAWTEDPKNTLAQSLRGERERAITALSQALEQMPPSFDERRLGVQSLLEFYGEPLGAAGRQSTRHALEYIATKKDARKVYCQPGQDPLSLADLAGVRFYVLGPPTDLKLLKKSDPTKSGQEVYDDPQAPSLADSFFSAVRLHLGPQTTAPQEDGFRFPFEPGTHIPVQEAQQDPYFVECYGFSDEPGHGEAWRRIDHEWLSVASELALKLDNDTNNTSLVLAIELVESGQVLLFPADAQVGNWLSWEGLSWFVQDASGMMQSVKTKDLLNRTVFYKVGHHGSHNATLREKGLELMTSEDLVAMIPVERQMAEKKKWQMPFHGLLERLQEKTRGRLIRLDDGLPQQDQVQLTESEWAVFQARTRQTDLFVECWFP